MKNLATKMSVLAITALLGFSISSCTTEDTTNPPGTTNGATGVAANSGSSSSINVQWIRNSADVSTDTVVASVGGVAVATALAAAPGNTATLNGLQAGQTYTITVNSTGGVSSAIQWATAQRTTGIRLYETADNTPGHNSGLWLGAPGGPTSVSLVGSNGANSDLVLASDQTAPFADIIAADVTGSGLPSGKATIVGDTIAAIAGGMDALYYTGDLSSRFNNASNSINFPTTSSVPLVFLAKTTDGHYARIQVNPQANGGLVGVDPVSGFYFVDLDVSYQTTQDLAYASRPHPMQHDVARRYSILGK